MSDKMPNDAFKRCIQVGVVVKDLDTKIRNLIDIFGIGPVRVIDFPPEGRSDMERWYHGQPAQFTCRLAFADLGSVELELIEPLQGEGIHHIRFNTFDEKPIIESLAEKDVPVEQYGSGTRPGTAYFYFDSQDKVGFAMEIMRAVSGTDGRAMPIGKVIE
jgi:hypothetical protein